MKAEDARLSIQSYGANEADSAAILAVAETVARRAGVYEEWDDARLRDFIRTAGPPPGRIKFAPVDANVTFGRTIEVVGESFREAELNRLHRHLGAYTRVVAALVPEPENPHDRNAVAVYLYGVPVGYLGRQDAAGLVGAVGRTIAEREACAVNAGLRFRSVVLEPDLTGVTGFLVADILRAARIDERTETQPGFTLRENTNDVEVFWSGGDSTDREDEIPAMQAALQAAGLQVRTASSDERVTGYVHLVVRR